MDRVTELEEESIFILREAFAQVSRIGLLWSMGKDSTVALWLTRKAFMGHVPYPVIHIDTTYKIPAMIAYRDQVAQELGLELIVGRNDAALKSGMNHTRGRRVCCGALKTKALQQVIEQHKFNGIVVAIRHDEEGSRGKERVFSRRTPNSEWQVTGQAAEFWNQYRTQVPVGEHVRVHPILRWTEMDVWRYIEREQIPVMPLYFAVEGRRYRSLGCAPCTSACDSGATSVAEIIQELANTKRSERSGRAQDQENSHAMEKLRLKGYM